MPTPQEELPDFDTLNPEVLAGYVEAGFPRKMGVAVLARLALEVVLPKERERRKREKIIARLALDALKCRSEDAAISPVTGLPNRKALELRASLARSRSVGDGVPRTGAPLSWLTAFVDLNGFKGINDAYGHPQGDRSLLLAGAALRASIRGEDDELYHLSGDEFVLFLPRRTPEPEAEVRLQSHLVDRFHNNLILIANGEGAHLLPEGFGLTNLDRQCAESLTGTFGFHGSEGPTIDRMTQLAVADKFMMALKQRSPER